jgi:hypothetical protein
MGGAGKDGWKAVGELIHQYLCRDKACLVSFCFHSAKPEESLDRTQLLIHRDGVTQTLCKEYLFRKKFSLRLRLIREWFLRLRLIREVRVSVVGGMFENPILNRSGQYIPSSTP